jgi:hypothetical protein
MNLRFVLPFPVFCSVAMRKRRTEAARTKPSLVLAPEKDNEDAKWWRDMVSNQYAAGLSLLASLSLSFFLSLSLSALATAPWMPFSQSATATSVYFIPDRVDR